MRYDAPAFMSPLDHHDVAAGPSAPVPSLDDPLDDTPREAAAPASAYDAALREAEELRRRPHVSAGLENIIRQHSKGRMTIWERIRVLTPEPPRVIFENWGPNLDGASLVTAILRIGSRDVAVGRYLKLAGLEGLVSPDDPQVASGVVEVDGGWRVAQDPKSFDFGQPDMRASVDRLTVPLVLARGSEDHLVREANVTEFVDDPITLDGLGHNPHLQEPAAIAGLVAR